MYGGDGNCDVKCKADMVSAPPAQLLAECSGGGPGEPEEGQRPALPSAEGQDSEHIHSLGSETFLNSSRTRTLGSVQM